MTLVLAVGDAKGAVIAADSSTFDPKGDLMSTKRYPKVFELTPDVAMGLAGEDTDLVRHALLADFELELDRAYPPEKQLEKAIRKVLTLNDIKHEHWEGLAIVNGSIIFISNLGGCATTADDYAAIGSPSAIAYGAMYAWYDQTDVKAVATLALNAAAKHSPFCRGPFEFVEQSGASLSWGKVID